MRAALFYGPEGSWPQKPIAIEDRPEPRPGPEDVLVKIAACGLCRTDLELLKGEGRFPKPPPTILGHEPSGIVVEVGSEVRGIKVGQRVLVVPTIPCFSCSWCRNGHDNQCPNMGIIGGNRDGAFTEYLVAPEVVVFPLPDSLPLEESAIITDAVGTSYHAVYDIAKVRPGDTVAIFGASGGLGLMCVQFAHAIGATTIGVGRKRWKLDMAKELGADEIISIDEVGQASRAIRRLTKGGADISIDATGIPGMVEEAFHSTRSGGKVVEVGLGFRTIQLELNRLLWSELQVMGAKNYKVVDMPRIIGLVARGVINLGKVVSHRFKLEEINEAYLTMDRGEMLRGIVIP